LGYPKDTKAMIVGCGVLEVVGGMSFGNGDWGGGTKPRRPGKVGGAGRRSIIRVSWLCAGVYRIIELARGEFRSEHAVELESAGRSQHQRNIRWVVET